MGPEPPEHLDSAITGAGEAAGAASPAPCPENAASPLLELENVSFSYPGRPEPVLRGVELSLQRGEVVLLTGPTGCGKSTLLKLLNGIIPLESSGRLEGRVRLLGRDTKTCTLPELAQQVGLVFQSPDDQLFCTTIYDEVAFGPRNLGLAPDEVDRRVRRALERVGLGGLTGGFSARLSGGQKQRLAIASQLAMQPELLALDEPISQLDPLGAAEVLKVVGELARGGMTVLLVEHRLEEALKLVSRVVVMEAGRLVLDCPVERLTEHMDLFLRLGLKLPERLMLCRRLGVPWGRETAAALERLRRRLRTRVHPVESQETPETIMSLEKVGYTYPQARQPALEGVSLELRQGEVLAIVGPNGSGKSTLLSIMAGLCRPQQGRVWLGERELYAGRDRHRRQRLALLFQNPDLLLIEPSVLAQLSPPRGRGRTTQVQERARELARRLDLEALGDSPPWALSKGQRLRLALGSLLSLEPLVLLLDEPTTGQNQGSVHRLLEEIGRRREIGAVVLCSHDLETVCRFAHRLLVLHEGRVQALGPVRQVLSDRACLEGLCPAPPLALELSRQAGLQPPLLTIDELMRFLEED